MLFILLICPVAAIISATVSVVGVIKFYQGMSILCKDFEGR